MMISSDKHKIFIIWHHNLTAVALSGSGEQFVVRLYARKQGRCGAKRLLLPSGEDVCFCRQMKGELSYNSTLSLREREQLFKFAYKFITNASEGMLKRCKCCTLTRISMKSKISRTATSPARGEVIVYPSPTNVAVHKFAYICYPLP